MNLPVPSALRVLLLTPPGRGAIATLRVEGAAALAAVAEDFTGSAATPWETAETTRPLFGHFGAAPREPVVVCRRSAAAVEIHCHGGIVAVERIIECLVARGAVVLPWQPGIASAAADPLTAAAHVALADARTERAAAILLDQYAGALRAAVNAVERALAGGDLPAAAAMVAELLARADLGLHLATPWRVVIAGPPNAGKSSLLNALLGYTRAIVHPTAGTTRDVVTAATAIDGWPVELADTAGLRDTAGALEQAGIALAQQEMDRADLVLRVVDVEQSWDGDELAVLASSARVIVVLNKVDRLPSPPRLAFAGYPASALTGQGIDVLLPAISQRLVPAPPAAGAAVPFTSTQVATLRETLAFIKAHDGIGAAQTLAALRGAGC